MSDIKTWLMWILVFSWKLKFVKGSSYMQGRLFFRVNTVSHEHRNNHKCVASCRLSFIHANNDFCKHYCTSYKNFDYYLIALFLYILWAIKCCTFVYYQLIKSRFAQSIQKLFFYDWINALQIQRRNSCCTNLHKLLYTWPNDHECPVQKAWKH
jgi:hypothetical protein